MIFQLLSPHDTLTLKVWCLSVTPQFQILPEPAEPVHKIKNKNLSTLSPCTNTNLSPMVIHIQTWEQSPKKCIQILAEPTNCTNTNSNMCYDIVKCKKISACMNFSKTYINMNCTMSYGIVKWKIESSKLSNVEE